MIIAPNFPTKLIDLSEFQRAQFDFSIALGRMRRMKRAWSILWPRHRMGSVNSHRSTEFQADHPASVTYSCAGRRWSLPVHCVRTISRAVDAAPVPFAGFGFEGLVPTDAGLAAQIDLSQALGGAPRTGTSALLVETAAGLVSVRVEHATLGSEPPGDETASGTADIQSLILGLAPSEPDSNQVPDGGALDPGKPFDVLVVACGARLLALPAVAVEEIGRHQGVRHARKGGDAERIVTVETDFLPGWSVGAWLGGDDAGETEPWAVVVLVGGERTALTVGRIHGIVSAPISQIRRVRHRNEDALWLLDPTHGMIEVIEPAEIAGRSERPARALLEGLGWPPAKVLRERRAAERGLLSVDFGPFACVFRSQRVAEVFGSRRDPISPHRGRGLAPLLDARALLGLPASESGPGRVLLLKRPGLRSLALHVPEVGPAAAEPDWHPLPLVPPLVRGLFEAVRLRDGRCDFLVRDSVFGGKRDPVLSGLMTRAQRGWVTVA